MTNHREDPALVECLVRGSMDLEAFRQFDQSRPRFGRLLILTFFYESL